MNIQLQAEVEGLKEEMMKQQRQMQIAQEVQNRIEAQNRDPRKEIIREFQQVIQPTVVPVPQPQDHSQLISLFERAVASQNHNIGRTAEQMGLSMQQLVEMLKDKDKGKEQPSMIASTSNMPPPPPPPPTVAAIEKFNIATPRSRSRSVAQVPPVTTAAAATPSREPSLASTVDYRSRSRSKAVQEPPRAKSQDAMPQPQVILPIQEDEPTRGRSLTRKADTAMAKRAIALLAQKQQQVQNEGQMRVHLGRLPTTSRPRERKLQHRRFQRVAPTTT